MHESIGMGCCLYAILGQMAMNTEELNRKFGNEYQDEGGREMLG